MSDSTTGIGFFALLAGVASGCVAYQASGESILAGVFAGLGGAFIGALLTNLLLIGPLVMAVFIIPGASVGAIVATTTGAHWGIASLAGVGAAVLSGFVMGWLAGWARKFPGDVDETMPAADQISRALRENAFAAGEPPPRGEFGGPFSRKRKRRTK